MLFHSFVETIQNIYKTLWIFRRVQTFDWTVFLLICPQLVLLFSVLYIFLLFSFHLFFSSRSFLSLYYFPEPSQTLSEIPTPPQYTDIRPVCHFVVLSYGWPAVANLAISLRRRPDEGDTAREWVCMLSPGSYLSAYLAAVSLSLSLLLLLLFLWHFSLLWIPMISGKQFCN